MASLECRVFMAMAILALGEILASRARVLTSAGLFRPG
jgi:hypothetical protein